MWSFGGSNFWAMKKLLEREQLLYRRDKKWGDKNAARRLIKIGWLVRMISNREKV